MTVKNKKYTITFNIHKIPIGTLIGNPTFSELERFKKILADECELSVDDIEVEIDENPEYSDIDVTEYGLMNWKDTQGTILEGTVQRLVGWDVIFDNRNNQNFLENCFELK